MRCFYELMRGADETSDSHLWGLIRDEPAATGSDHFDALLAAAAEYLAYRIDRAAPAWATQPQRFLDHGWWVVDLPSARASALINTPAPFKRRGIYLDAHDLDSA